jgi:hypothetical protein
MTAFGAKRTLGRSGLNDRFRSEAVIHFRYRMPALVSAFKKNPRTNFLIRGFVSRAFVEIPMVAKSVNFSGHRYIPCESTGPFVLA